MLLWEYETRRVIYHSAAWCVLVEQGWITRTVEGQIAIMIRLRH
ncbi:hypothetical protein LCGC14_1477810 [marine sediment metagenome]|uniref:Uncharacterized protein n=1 Tax=marine sediment metagenome TaxID=412755 RepID=A0A0F9JB69_9ZZZZ